jgi:Sec-independent protein translocase protein TatA
MAHHALSSQESYNPNHLLDILLGKMQLKNDAALSRMLEVAPPVISKIRHHRLPVGASLLIRMHEVTGMSIRDLRDLMGDRRTKYRLSDAQGRPKPEEKAAQLAAQQAAQQQQGQPQGQSAQSQSNDASPSSKPSGNYAH